MPIGNCKSESTIDHEKCLSWVCWADFYRYWRSGYKFVLCLTHIPAASMKGRFSLKVRRGSLRFLRKSLRRPVMAWISSTLLSTGTVLLRRNFSFRSFTVRSAPDRRYSPVWERRNRLNHGLIYLWLSSLYINTFLSTGREESGIDLQGADSKYFRFKALQHRKTVTTTAFLHNIRTGHHY